MCDSVQARFKTVLFCGGLASSLDACTRVAASGRVALGEPRWASRCIIMVLSERCLLACQLAS
jgi:hypothetical protein